MTRLALILALALIAAIPIATPVGAQSAPTTCDGTAPHCNIISWVAPQGGGPLANYKIMRSLGPSGAPTFIGGTSFLFYIDNSTPSNSLAEGQTYCYTIVASGHGGDAAPSPQGCGTIPGPGTGPPNPVTGAPTVVSK